MRRKCEELRDRALCEGLSSRSALAWRTHCRDCPSCRTELFVLQTLQRQAVSERCHLGRREMLSLLRTARTQRRRRKPVEVVWTWSLRLACLVMVLLVAAEFNRASGRNSANRRNGPRTPLARRAATMAMTSSAADSASPASAANIASLERETISAEALAWPSSRRNRGVTSRLCDLRRRVDTQRERLLELLERDLGDRSRRDVWDNEQPFGSAWA